MKYTTQKIFMDIQQVNPNTSSMLKIDQTIAALANANELVRFVAMDVVGNEISDTIDGSPLSRETIYGLTQSKIMTEFNKFRGN